jgi:hypothetical protein
LSKLIIPPAPDGVGYPPPLPNPFGPTIIYMTLHSVNILERVLAETWVNRAATTNLFFSVVHVNVGIEVVVVRVYNVVFEV